MKEAVLFDLDGVLLDSMPYHCKAWQQVFARLGVDIQPEEIYSREGTRTAELARALVKDHGLELDEEAILHLIDEKSKVYNAISRAELMPGAVDLLEKLKRRGLLTAIVTSTFRENLEKILPPEFLRQFEAIVTGEDVSIGKPHPRPYLLAAERLEKEPARCVAVENAPLGVKSAHAAGMPCVAITSTQSADKLREADWIFADLREFLDNLNQVLLHE